MKRRFGFWEVTLGLVLVALVAITVVRFARGLGAISNLSDEFPWGIWVGFDVLCRVGLAAGAFTLAAVVHIFNLERFKPILRPAVLTGFLGYLSVIMGLAFELGQPWRIWHTLIYWNPHSVMFEVAWCVMLYTTVLVLEFSPVLLEHFQLRRAQRVIAALATPLVIAGVILSTLHQASLGSMFLIFPGKLHPLWYTTLLPLLFFVSAIGAGIGMIILQSYLCERAFGRGLDMDLLEPLARSMVVALGVYGLLRWIVIWQNGSVSLLLHPGYEATMFLVEMGLGVVLPVGLLAVDRVRRSPSGLVVGALCALLGFFMNRLDVSVTGMEAAIGMHYLPAWTEVTVSLGLLAVAAVLFALAVRYLPVFPAVPVAPARRPATG